MIDGVTIKRLKVIPDERGRLMEILRSDDEDFTKFGQVYMTTCLPGVVKGWHWHKIQTDCMTVVSGMMKIVLFDSRGSSPTRGRVEEIFAGEHNPVRVKIPPGVMHGFTCIGEREAIVVNTVTEPYRYDSPDEYRVDPHDNDIPYTWKRRDG
ncbi:MAG: dTDP-4-dehydrorhamnose 3,5-epimerase family protein [Candidatus Krumholzibacteria bacterium]|nr:dTDP-4-dehydrorhamnose 3,5-epimerase family protein [Candidatus Krumholzibacteria bacterium]